VKERGVGGNKGPPNPVDEPEYILALLSRLHALSEEQEAQLTSGERRLVSPDGVGGSSGDGDGGLATSKQAQMREDFDHLCATSSSARDKVQFVYAMLRAMGTTAAVGARIQLRRQHHLYLALAVAQNKAAGLGKHRKLCARVIAAEKEPAKADQAHKSW